MKKLFFYAMSVLALAGAPATAFCASSEATYASQQLSARPVAINRPALVRPGETFTVELTVLNESATPIRNVEIESTIGDSSSTATYTFEYALMSNIQTAVKIDMTSDMDNDNLPLTFRVTKIDGQENLDSREILETYICCSFNYELRNVLIEKNTGTRCGFCPGAYYAFERMKEEVTDGSFIPVAVHNYPADPMHCYSYEPWNNKYVGTAAPSATYSRSPSFDAPPYYEALKTRFNLLRTVSYVDIYLQSTTSGNELNVQATAHFKKDLTDLDYGFGFILTEDNVGPYSQTNNYSGGVRGAMGGFENEPNPVSLIYNDVARDIFDWEGAEGSIPEDVTAGKDYVWNKTLSLSHCTKPENVKITAFIADRKTGEIVNAIRSTPGVSVNVTEMKDVANEPKVTCHGSTLSATGNFSIAKVYSTDGRFIGSLRSGGTMTLPTGLYIVRTEGTPDAGKTFKVVAN